MSKEKVVRKPVEKIKPGQIVLFVVTILLGDPVSVSGILRTDLRIQE